MGSFLFLGLNAHDRTDESEIRVFLCLHASMERKGWVESNKKKDDRFFFPSFCLLPVDDKFDAFFFKRDRLQGSFVSRVRRECRMKKLSQKKKKTYGDAGEEKEKKKSPFDAYPHESTEKKMGWKRRIRFVFLFFSTTIRNEEVYFPWRRNSSGYHDKGYDVEGR
jgi:hypothetical protein